MVVGEGLERVNCGWGIVLNRHKLSFMPETDPLPRFTYHPDPVATGTIVRSEVECVVCGLSRGWIYTGPTYCETDIDEQICPWCIADGRAHQKFGAEFVDPPGIGGYGKWSPVPRSVVEVVSQRTPSFSGWQQERWFTHCDDAAVFLGPVGKSELEELGPAAREAIKVESGYDEAQWSFYFEQMDKQYGPTGYVFRCRRCGVFGGYSDCL